MATRAAVYAGNAAIGKHEPCFVGLLWLFLTQMYRPPRRSRGCKPLHSPQVDIPLAPETFATHSKAVSLMSMFLAARLALAIAAWLRRMHTGYESCHKKRKDKEKLWLDG